MPQAIADLAALEADPEAWLCAMYPDTFVAPPASYHRRMNDWFAGIEKDTAYYTLVEVLSRGFAKSTRAESLVTYAGATGRRRYVLYVSGTQDQADTHVQSIGDKLESSNIDQHYPLMAQREVNKFGSPRGWRRNRLWTAQGFIIDALGLDTAARGIKLGDQRPDLMVFDDIDGEDDSQTTIERKIRALTSKILPARARHGCTLVVQNLIHANGIVARLVDGRAEFLAEREVDGPHPALRNMVWERDGLTRQGKPKARIVDGEPTWDYMDIANCQAMLDEIGLPAFLQECQHEVQMAGEPRFDRDALQAGRDRYQCDPLPERLLPSWMRGIQGLRVYSLPAPGIAYAAYTDPAEAKGRDYTATVIGEVETRQTVAVLEDNTREGAVHADIVVTLLQHYHEAYYGWERARDSEIALTVGRLGYTRIYKHQDAPLTNLQLANGAEPALRVGYPMTADTKKALIARMANAIETGRAPLLDERLYDQAMAYIVTADMKTEAANAGHDDLVIAYAGFLLMTEQPQAKRVKAAYGYEQELVPAGRREPRARGTWA